MRKPLKVVAAVVLLGAGIAACSGGGSSLPPATNAKPTTPGTIAAAPKQNVSFSLTVPAASASHARKPQYIPSTTQSFKVLETDNGAAPNPPVVQNTAPGSPNCTTNTSGTTCTITIAANIGSDSFTVSAYDGANATGNLLASGTVLGTVAAGVANAFPLTLNGQVATVTLGASDAYPEVGTPTTLYVEAKDATGNTIIGTYNAPVTLTSTGSAAISPSAVSTSSTGPITIAASTSQTARYTVTASFNGATSTLTIAPSSGIVSYNVGAPGVDSAGFGMLAGNDGNIYYTTLGGTQSCANGFCTYTAGFVGQFNPATGASSELQLPGSGAVDPYQTSDGTLWVPAPVTNSLTGAVARISGGFTSSNMNVITLPSPAPNTTSAPREITLGSDGNLYLTGNKDHSIYQIPTTTTTTATITRIPLPVETSAPGAPYCCRWQSNGQSIVSGSDGALYIGNSQFGTGSLLKYVPNGAFTNIQAPYAPQTETPRFLAVGSDGNIYASYGANCTTCGGALTSYNPSTGVIAPVTIPSQYSIPDHLATSNGQISWADRAAYGFGTYNIASGDVTLVPTESGSDFVTLDPSISHIPGGLTYTSSGDLWLISGGRSVLNGQLAISRVVMTGAWSVWPSSNVTLFGTGAQNAQVIGLLESANSGPFTLTGGTCASLQQVSGASHNFLVVGSAAGSCTVSIKDSNGRVKTLSVSVTATNGTISSVGSRVGAAAHKGGSI